jgi:hypothetical protein
MHSQLLPPLDEITHVDLSERVDRISALPYALDPGIPVGFLIGSPDFVRKARPKLIIDVRIAEPMVN